MDIEYINNLSPMNEDDLRIVEGGCFVMAITICGVLGGLFWMGYTIGKDGAEQMQHDDFRSNFSNVFVKAILIFFILFSFFFIGYKIGKHGADKENKIEKSS